MIRMMLAAALVWAPAVPASAARYGSWRCKTSNGRYDRRELAIPARATSISGTAVFHGADFGPVWNPVANVGFGQKLSVDGNCHCSGLKMIAFPDPVTVEVHGMANGIDKPISQNGFEFPLHFRIAIEARDVMTIRIGTTGSMFEKLPVRYPDHDTLAMSCSGADVTFSDIKVE